MKRKDTSSSQTKAGTVDLFAKLENRRRRVLFLPIFLEQEASCAYLRGQKQEEAFKILTRWAELEAKGHLTRKETALDADFLHQVFGDALGYAPATRSPDKYHLERNFTVPGVGTAGMGPWASLHQEPMGRPSP